MTAVSRFLALAHDRRFRADAALLLTAVIWGSAFSAQRAAAPHLGPLLYNGLRFFLAGAVLYPIVRRSRQPIGRLEWRGGAAVGVVAAAASVLQQAGLEFTTAGKAGFITSLYVVLVPLFLALIWRQWPRWTAALASLLATVGLFLLSVEGGWALAPGDGLELIGAVFWALHVILVGRLASQTRVLHLSLVQVLVCGLLNTALGLALEWRTLPGLEVAWWAVLYGGVLSVGVAYTLQVQGQKTAPPADAAILLSLESVFAALFGWLFLAESLSGRQILGCALMFASVILSQSSLLFRSRAAGPVLVSTIEGEVGG